MRSIEDKIDIPESRKDDFRREIMNYIGALSIDGKTFNYKTTNGSARRWSSSCSKIRKTQSSSRVWCPMSSTPTRSKRSTSSKAA